MVQRLDIWMELRWTSGLLSSSYAYRRVGICSFPLRSSECVMFLDLCGLCLIDTRVVIQSFCFSLV